MNLRTVVVQVNTRDNLADNLSNVARFLDQAADVGAEFISLPEFWTYLGPSSGYDSAAQAIPGPIIEILQDKARKYHLIVHGGSILERDHQLAGKFYNTTVLINRDGEVVARY
ncbi:MAG: nitrilase-related carbon-nitrogen hydrolase, partial [Ktedonobacteraceae bacterium]